MLENLWLSSSKPVSCFLGILQTIFDTHIALDFKALSLNGCIAGSRRKGVDQKVDECYTYHKSLDSYDSGDLHHGKVYVLLNLEDMHTTL